jgi:MFS family permease
VFARYRRVLAIPALRQALVLGFLVRMPIFAGGVVITLHVVSHLGRTYGAAGLVSAAATIAIAVSGPWRGRLLDQRGLRRVVVPSIVVAAVCWSIAPFVGYWWLLALAALAGLFVIPSFSIIRQAILAAVPEVVEVRLSLPNRHHFLVDMSLYGLDNPGEVFNPDDRPYGLIEGTMLREDAPPAGLAWSLRPGA